MYRFVAQSLKLRVLSIVLLLLVRSNYVSQVKAVQSCRCHKLNFGVEVESIEEEKSVFALRFRTYPSWVSVNVFPFLRTFGLIDGAWGSL